MDAVTLSAAAGVLLSLILSYTPRLAPWFQTQKPDTKRLVMLVLLAVVAGGAYGLSCANVDLGIAIACDRAGAIEAVKAFMAAAVLNQAAYQLSPGLSKG